MSSDRVHLYSKLWPAAYMAILFSIKVCLIRSEFNWTKAIDGGDYLQLPDSEARWWSSVLEVGITDVGYGDMHRDCSNYNTAERRQNATQCEIANGVGSGARMPRISVRRNGEKDRPSSPQIRNRKLTDGDRQLATFIVRVTSCCS